MTNKNATINKKTAMNINFAMNKKTAMNRHITMNAIFNHMAFIGKILLLFNFWYPPYQCVSAETEITVSAPANPGDEKGILSVYGHLSTIADGQTVQIFRKLSSPVINVVITFKVLIYIL